MLTTGPRTTCATPLSASWAQMRSSADHGCAFVEVPGAVMVCAACSLVVREASSLGRRRKGAAAEAAEHLTEAGVSKALFEELEMG